ncbi:hypothetical protein VTN31DRAFT_3880 [Thermomyces dupontii]|uniref:uncharacterized protein n=1 Tax=Talaromyces thermophilus TaxID=28565 RepID=UPI003742DB24
MVKIEPFAVERWMGEYETQATHNIAETCCSPVSISDLQSLSSEPQKNPIPLATKLTYGAIKGSEQLRGLLAHLYSVKTSTPLPLDNILITTGGIQANFLLHYALVEPGDHVICHYPTYQQLYSVAESLGAEVSLWKAKEEDNWTVNIKELESLIRPTTKVIILNNPQNPTGAIIPRSVLQEIVAIAEQHSITVHADEVYRPLFHSISPADTEFPPSLLNLGYKNTVVTSSMSKAYSLAGIRLGWIASRSGDIIERCMNSRDYTTISVSQLDDAVASYALAPQTLHNLLHRNIELAKTNLSLLEKFVESHRWACEWSRPRAGTVAFVKFTKMGRPVDDVAFCKLLIERTGVLFVPGSSCFGRDGDFKGYVRIGFVTETQILQEALQKLGDFLRKDFVDDVPLAS